MRAVMNAAVRIFLFSAAYCVIGGAPISKAQDAAAFYRAHPQLTIAYPSDDLYPRLLAQFLPKYIPGNPTIIVQQVPTAGGLVLANQTYNTARKDGTWLALIRGSTIQLQVNGDSAAKFDARKFAWIGNMDSERDTCIVPAARAIPAIQDLYGKQFIIGASGAGSQSYTFPVIYRDILHMNLKVIPGYIHLGDRLLGMERGELDGACGFDTSTIQSSMSGPFKEGKIKILFQAGLSKDPRFSDIPNILDQAKDDEQRQTLSYMFATLELGRPFALPPETPSDRVALLRDAFDRAMRDPELQEEADKIHIDIQQTAGTDTASLVDRLYDTPKTIVERVQAVINANQ